MGSRILLTLPGNERMFRICKYKMHFQPKFHNSPAESTAPALPLLVPRARRAVFIWSLTVPRKKELNDYPWLQAYWSDLIMAASMMTGEQFKASVIEAYESWMENDYGSLPKWAKRGADRIRAISDTRSGK